MAEAHRTFAVVLAAGEGKRLRSSTSKVLHRAAGRPLLGHVLRALEPLGLERTVVVTPADNDAFGAVLDGADAVVQDPPAGTADAVKVALARLPAEGTLLVLPGDTPLIETASLEMLLERRADGNAACALLTTRMTDPAGYGRVIRNGSGGVERIVEERDASEAERAVDEVNGSVYAFDLAALSRVLERIDRENAQSEWYLTDAVELLAGAGEQVIALEVTAAELTGVNSRAQLAEVTALLHARNRRRLLEAGVTLVDPATTFVDDTVEVAADATIHPFTFLEGATHIGARAEVGPQTRVIDSQVGEDAVVTFAVLRQCEIGPEASVGPFASLRPGTRLGRGARAGTFVETKGTELGDGSKANHLAYLGDARIGSGVNVGAGTITCNWDGQSKHETVIEDDAYIGSDTMLVAPVHIGARAATGAGSVVKGEVPDDALAVGVPARILEGRGDKMGRKPTRATDDGGG